MVLVVLRVHGDVGVWHRRHRKGGRAVPVGGWCAVVTTDLTRGTILFCFKSEQGTGKHSEMGTTGFEHHDLQAVASEATNTTR